MIRGRRVSVSRTDVHVGLSQYQQTISYQLKTIPDSFDLLASHF
jgi:hypothetical protein